MKNLFNKVLVVLTVSAVFAGNVNATPRKNKPAIVEVNTKKMTKRERAVVKMAKERAAIETGDFFVNVKEYGAEDFGRWTREARIDALIKQYGDLDAAPKNLKLFLIGDDKNQSVDFRLKYKKAINELGNTTTKDAIEEVKVATKRAEEATTPDAQAEMQQQLEDKTGYLASLMATAKGYLTPSVVLAAKTVLGAAVVSAAVYYGPDLLDKASTAVGSESRPGAWMSSKAGDVGTYLSTTRPAGWMKSGYDNLPSRPTWLGGTAITPTK